MFPILHHLWRKVIERSTECRAAVSRRMNGPPEVADFQFAVDADEDVFGFDVAVDDVFSVEVDEGVGHLGDVLS
jgi:hypothetical protein